MELKEAVRAFWDSHPCGVQFGGDQCGSRAFFERVERHRYWLEPHIPSAADFAAARGLRVLEIGCGLGTDGMQFMRAGAVYTGIDLSPTAVALANQRMVQLGLRGSVRLGDAEALDFDDAGFDIVYSHGVLHHTPDISRALSEIKRVLCPGGRVIVMLYNRTSINYYVKIRLLRRARAPLLRTQSGITAVSRVWPDRLDELRKHGELIRSDPQSYFRPDTFLRRNTDGAACPVSRAFSEAEARALFHQFEAVTCRTYSRRAGWWPAGAMWREIHKAIGSRWGWHMWVYASKSTQPWTPSR